VPNEILFRVLILVAVVIVLIFLIIQAYQKFRKLHRRYVNAIKDALLAIKIIITYLQINLSIPGMITSFEFPPNYRTFMANLSFVNVDFMSVLGIQVSHIFLVSLWVFFSFLSANATRQTD
jgi:branched-subunit amino acid ABC-type transport system permease component